jgi:hypothetical protein
MHIVAALFVDNFAMRQVEGPSTRIDLTGVFFSQVAPQPVPCTMSPHLVVLIYCPAGESGDGILQVVFQPVGVDPDATPPMAQNVSPFRVEPGKFTYRLVRAELAVERYGQIIAHCRVGQGAWMAVPFTVLAPVASQNYSGEA